MSIFDKIINEEITLEEGAKEFGCTVEDLQKDLVSYFAFKNRQLPQFLKIKKKRAKTNKKKKKKDNPNRLKVSLSETEFIPTFAVEEGLNEAIVIPSLKELFERQLTNALNLQTTLRGTDHIDQYISVQRLIQKYIDQMQELDLEQKYTHKEQFDLVFKFMIEVKNDYPGLEEKFILLLEGFREEKNEHY